MGQICAGYPPEYLSIYWLAVGDLMWAVAGSAALACDWTVFQCMSSACVGQRSP